MWQCLCLGAPRMRLASAAIFWQFPRSWGPAFCGSDGKVARTRVYEEMFYDLLGAAQE